MNTLFSFNTALKAFTVYCCFTFIFFQRADAQSAVLTNANLTPKIGDVFIFKYCKTNRYDTGFAGAKKTWDYSYLKDSVNMATGKKVIDTQTCIMPAQTPFAGSFPKATIATTHTLIPEYHYDYYSGGSFFAYWGYVLGFFDNVYSKALALTPKYPFAYGSTFFTTSQFTDQNNLTYNVKDSLHADGYGTLKLPNRTIHNVVKIKQVYSYTSAIYHTRTRIESYVFVTPNYHAGLLNLQRIKITSLQNNATLSDSTSIWYAQNTSRLPLQTTSAVVTDKNDFSSTHSLFSISPKPTKDFINIVSSSNVAAAQVKITDMSGKTLFVSRQNFVAGQQLKVSLTPFRSEVLIVTIESNSNREQFKIVKE